VRLEIGYTDEKIRVKQWKRNGVAQNRPHSQVLVDVDRLSKNITQCFNSARIKKQAFTMLVSRQ
jgi:hypothetical protein